MINPYGEESYFNRFLLVSVVLHAIVFLTFPQWSSLFTSDTPGIGDGGVIKIVGMQSSVNSLPSPVTDRLSQTTRPRVTEPRPLPEAAPVQNAVAQSQPAEVPEVSSPQPSPTPDPVVEEVHIPEPVAEAEIPVPEAPAPEVETPVVEASESTVGEGELLTSETGREVAVADQDPGLQSITPPSDPRPQPEEQVPAGEETVGASGSGTGVQGEDDNAGISQSGTGTAESAPPAPPPPPSGGSLHAGGGSPTYPKNASHLGVGGTVQLVAAVRANGDLISVVISSSSGHSDLDMQALRTVENLWAFRTAEYDYTIELFIHFKNEGGEFSTSYDYGEVEWINLP